MARRIKWHKRDEKPLVLETNFLVQKDDPSCYTSHIDLDYIEKNFDEWADDVTNWGYLLESDEEEHERKAKIKSDDKPIKNSDKHSDKSDSNIKPDKNDRIHGEDASDDIDWDAIIEDHKEALRNLLLTERWGAINWDKIISCIIVHDECSRQRDDGDIPCDVSCRNIYHDYIRRKLSEIEKGSFSMPNGYYDRILQLFNYAEHDKPVFWELFSDDRYWAK